MSIYKSTYNSSTVTYKSTYNSSKGRLVPRERITESVLITISP